MKNNSIRKAIRLCDESYTFDQNELLVEMQENTNKEVNGMSFSKVMDKAIKACDEERKIGEFGGIKYEITENSDGSFNIKLNGQPHKNHARFSSLREAEKNVQMNIGEILSYERATGKKALIRNFA